MSDLTEHQISVLLERLENEERDISLRRRKLHDRIAMFPDGPAKEELERREREISTERRELHRRIDELHVQRTELRAQHGEPAL
jgi:predicted  nucleic acid-binding Zn-ribbon protein